MSTSGFQTSPASVDPAASAPVQLRPVGDWTPLFALFITAAFWLVLGSVFGLISSIKFHSPEFLADPAWLTYGRVRAAFVNLLLYGFAVPGGLGCALWILLRTGGVRLVFPGAAIFGVVLLNAGAMLGLGGILSGDMSGIEGFEMPAYSAVFVLMGYVLVAVSALLTLHNRRNAGLTVPQWYMLAAIFWFPWIHSTAILLLLVAPVRGVAQPIIGWWFAANLQLVWLGLVGLGTAFHLLPQALNRELNSRNLALFAFWILVLFGSWTGVPQTAPAPAWVPALSGAATIVTTVLFISVYLASKATTKGLCKQAWSGSAAFSSFGLAAFIAVGLLSILPVVFGRGEWLSFTWMNAARWQLLVYGFFGLIAFGCIHDMADHFTGTSAKPRMHKAQFLLASIGVALLGLSLIGAGIMQDAKLRNPDVAFVDVTKATLHFLRLSTIGDLLMVAANGLILIYLLSLVVSAARIRARSALQAATAEVAR